MSDELDAALQESPSSPALGLTGNISAASASASSSSYNRNGNSNTFSSGQTTLDEPIAVTFWRDARRIGVKLGHVLVPRLWKVDTEERTRNVRDWDLWGPLVFCLVLAAAMPERAADMFVLVWGGAAVVTMNSQLLRGQITFFQSVCVLGYCVFPMLVPAVLSGLLRSVIAVWIPLVAVALVWSIAASVGFLTSMVPDDRRALAVYPVVLFYTTLAWLVLMYKSEGGKSEDTFGLFAPPTTPAESG